MENDPKPLTFARVFLTLIGACCAIPGVALTVMAGLDLIAYYSLGALLSGVFGIMLVYIGVNAIWMAWVKPTDKPSH